MKDVRHLVVDMHPLILDRLESSQLNAAFFGLKGIRDWNRQVFNRNSLLQPNAFADESVVNNPENMKPLHCKKRQNRADIAVRFF